MQRSYHETQRQGIPASTPEQAVNAMVALRRYSHIMNKEKLIKNIWRRYTVNFKSEIMRCVYQVMQGIPASSYKDSMNGTNFQTSNGYALAMGIIESPSEIYFRWYFRRTCSGNMADIQAEKHYNDRNLYDKIVEAVKISL